MSENTEAKTITLSLIAPTYNESGNIPTLAERVFKALNGAGISGELVIVDDNSPDGTADLAEKLAAEKGYNIKVVRRPGKMGLSSAVIDGWNAASGAILGVIDADMSHDPNILPDMVYSITHGGADIALGSRYIKGGGVSNWPFRRHITSLVAVLMGRPLCPVNDVTSGYMMFKRQVIEGVYLDPIGFKINVEVMVRANYRTITEVPFIFTDRMAGTSKFNGKEIKNYLVQLVRLYWYRLRHPASHKRIPYTPFPH